MNRESLPSSTSSSLTIRQVIDANAARCPDAPFLIEAGTGKTLSFSGLRSEAHQVTRHLQSMGLVKGDKVALLLENGLFTAQLLLGAMYGGFVPVPISVIAGPGQVEHCLDHSDARVVFSAVEYRPLINACRRRIKRRLRIVEAEPDTGFAWPTPSTGLRLPEIQPVDEALIMYTSGSTGKARGVVFSHGNLLAGVEGTIRTYGFSPADRALGLLPLFHLNALVTTFLPMLLSGGSVVVPNRFNVSRLWAWVADHHCTWFAAVPGIISQLLERGERESPVTVPADTLRFVRVSSAPLAPALHQAFEDRFGVLVVEGMGMTEAGEAFQTAPTRVARKIGSPGRPCHELRIVDNVGELVGPGETGELQIRSPRIMKGYYKDPEATAQVLTAAGWLRTGDLGRVDEDGFVFITGRLKEVVIKGGVNIAPREIDEALMRHPSVREAAAVGVLDQVFGEDLIAYVVLKADVPGTVDEVTRQLMAHCVDQVGAFKTPSRIRLVPDLPRGPSGKVQRLRLLEIERAAGAEAGVRSTPHSGAGMADHERVALEPLQQEIRTIWREVLVGQAIGADTDFFDAGGDSLAAQRVIARVQERFGVDLPIRFLFENPTPRAMALEIQKLSNPEVPEE